MKKNVIQSLLRLLYDYGKSKYFDIIIIIAIAMVDHYLKSWEHLLNIKTLVLIQCWSIIYVCQKNKKSIIYGCLKLQIISRPLKKLSIYPQKVSSTGPQSPPHNKIKQLHMPVLWMILDTFVCKIHSSTTTNFDVIACLVHVQLMVIPCIQCPQKYRFLSRDEFEKGLICNFACKIFF